MFKKSLSIVFAIVLSHTGFNHFFAATKREKEARQSAKVQVNETILDDFEGPNAPASWVLSKGTEFPGADGSLALGAGHAGRGARLSYDFRGGGAYVAAILNLNRPQPATAIAFWVKSPAGVRIRLRVFDETGQTLQYNLIRPLTTRDTGSWYRHVVKLDGPTLHWGGANDGLVHGSLRAVSILAGDVLERGSFGEISFDEVAALTGSFDVSLNPTTRLASAPPAGSGELLPKLGVAIHFTDNNPALDAARAAGFTWVRMDIFWHQVEERRGVYNFSAYDRLIAALAARGMKALLILDYGNDLYTGNCALPGKPNVVHCPPTTSEAIQAFGNFAEATARHFAGRGVMYEIWNEPNLDVFWPPTPNPAQYAALARTAITRIHQGDPAAKVTTGGLAGFDFAFARGFVNAGGAQGADAFGVHPYSYPQPPEVVSDNMLLMGALAGQWSSPAKPIRDTEWGYSSSRFYDGHLKSLPVDGHSSSARARQAVTVARRLLLSWAMGFPLIIYYDLSDDGDDPNNPEHNFGLLTSNLTDKPAMVATRTLTGIARNRSLTGLINTGISGLHALRLSGEGNTVIALWYDAPGGGVEVRLPNSIRAINHLGQPIAFRTINGEPSLTVRESDGPVYITFGGTIANASAASFNTEALASESIAAAFGLRLATSAQVAATVPLPTTLAGTTAKFKDSAGIERSAPLFFVSPTQVNYQVPPGTATGKATMTITSGEGFVSIGTIQINAVAPGLFATNGDGQGAPAGYAIRVKADGSQANEPIARFDTTLNPPRFVAVPLDLGPATDQVFLVLFGTGIRFRSSLLAVTATIGGVSAPVLYAGAQQGLVGLDQVNLLVPRSLIGRGEVDVILTVDGKSASTMRVNIK